MKKILIPTDFSKKSKKNIAFALDSFTNEACEFYFIHTYSYQTLGFDALSLLHSGDEFFDEYDLEIMAKMVKHVGAFVNEPKNDNHKFKLLCKNSAFIMAIKEAVQKFEIDIVLIGTEGVGLNTTKYKEQKINLLLKEIQACPIMPVPMNENAWQNMGLEDIKLAS